MNSPLLTTLVGSMVALASVVDTSTPLSVLDLKRPALSDTSLVVHEWGTFTALQGSNGIPVKGMHHEDEHLPSFVHSRDPMTEPLKPIVRSCPRFNKGMEPIDCPSPSAPDALFVTQKMETPVLYFYSKNEVKNVRLGVRFPSGIISQYYPAPNFFQPSIGSIQSLTQGYTEFNFDILPDPRTYENPSIPEVSPDSVYAPSRHVNSNYIKTVNQEAEKLIFYRGLGNFSTSISVTSKNNVITIHNKSRTATMPSAILLSNNENSQDRSLGGFLVVPKLAPGEEISFTENDFNTLTTANDSEFIPRVTEALTHQLVAMGLYEDEAKSMVNTWKKSYFKTKGLRLLHILDPRETESLLPLTMTPAPTERIRVLVGRIEIMTESQEQALLSEILNGTGQGTAFDLQSLGRLAEPKLQRLKQLATTPFDKSRIQRYIDSLN